MTSHAAHTSDHPATARRLRPATPAQRLLTVPQASDYTGIPVRSLWDCIAAGGLAIVRLPGQTRRTWIDRRDLDKLIETSREVRS